METEKFETWAILELFGHQRIAGKASEATIGGCAFLRIDVPEHAGREAFTKYYGNGAIYSMTPVTEQVARAALERIEPEAVNVYGMRLIEAPRPGDDEEF